MIHQAIYNLYPNVTGISGVELPKAYDSNGGLVVIDMVAVEQEAQRMGAEAIAKEEAREAIRASALQKLVNNAGLTVEEVKSFINIEE